MQNPTHLVIPEANLSQETEKAYCFKLSDGQHFRYVNLPKSRIRDYQIIDGKCDFWIEEWLIAANGNAYLS